MWQFNVPIWKAFAVSVWRPYAREKPFYYLKLPNLIILT